MPLGIGSTVPTTCTGDANKLKTGLIFSFLKLPCSAGSTLQHLGASPSSKPSPQFKKLPLTSRRSSYLGNWNTYNLSVCDTTPTPTLFDAKKWTLLRSQVRIKTKCPFNGHSGVNYRIEMTYSEGISPTNFRSCGPSFTMDTLFPNSDTNGQDSCTISPADPFGFGSSGKGNCTLTLSVVDPDPGNPCSIPSLRLDAHLNSLGRAYDFLSGTPVDQVRFISCVDFELGIGALTGFWTGLSFAMGPIGLVMSMGYVVRGGFGYVG